MIIWLFLWRKIEENWSEDFVIYSKSLCNWHKKMAYYFLKNILISKMQFLNICVLSTFKNVPLIDSKNLQWDKKRKTWKKMYFNKKFFSKTCIFSSSSYISVWSCKKQNEVVQAKSITRHFWKENMMESYNVFQVMLKCFWIDSFENVAPFEELVYRILLDLLKRT